MRPGPSLRDDQSKVGSGVKLSNRNTGAVLHETLEGREMPVMISQYDQKEKAVVETTMILDVASMSKVYSLADTYYEDAAAQKAVGDNKLKQLILRTQAITKALRTIYGDPCSDSEAVKQFFSQHSNVTLSETLALGLAQCPAYGWLGCAYLERKGFETMAVAGYEKEQHAYALVLVDGEYIRICTTNPARYDQATDTYIPNVARLTKDAGAQISQAKEGIHDAEIIGLEGGNIIGMGTTRVGIAA